MKLTLKSYDNKKSVQQQLDTNRTIRFQTYYPKKGGKNEDEEFLSLAT